MVLAVSGADALATYTGDSTQTTVKYAAEGYKGL